jgi:hypothetical protein
MGFLSKNIPKSANCHEKFAVRVTPTDMLECSRFSSEARFRNKDYRGSGSSVVEAVDDLCIKIKCDHPDFKRGDQTC